MRTKYVGNRNGYSCLVACLESFLYSQGIIRTQEDIINEHPDLCKVAKDRTGKILEGVVQFGREHELFECEGVTFDLVRSIKDVGDLGVMHAAIVDLNSNEGFVIGLTHHDDQFHAVLFDSMDSKFDIWVMDPDSGYKMLAKDYDKIVKLDFQRISFSARSCCP